LAHAGGNPARSFIRLVSERLLPPNTQNRGRGCRRRLPSSVRLAWATLAPNSKAASAALPGEVAVRLLCVPPPRAVQRASRSADVFIHPSAERTRAASHIDAASRTRRSGAHSAWILSCARQIAGWETMRIPSASHAQSAARQCQHQDAAPVHSWGCAETCGLANGAPVV